MRVLVTGAAGFVGMHCAARLAARGDEVLGVDNLSPYYAVELKRDRLRQLEGKGNFAFERLDIADGQALEAVFARARPEAVLNLAAQPGVRYSLENPGSYVQSNLVGFANLLEACRRHAPRHLVYASSSSVYGTNAKLPWSETDNVDHPISLYAATKKANELM
ncbi:MAG TPA: GDP-mannose 4,6-dehydratase, partial [Burkholderiales bacterium]|nr:GDP-mannose 4,6-dehydratase [Burkholderiales bacterium]